MVIEVNKVEVVEKCKAAVDALPGMIFKRIRPKGEIEYYICAKLESNRLALICLSSGWIWSTNSTFGSEDYNFALVEPGTIIQLTAGKVAGD